MLVSGAEVQEALAVSDQTIRRWRRRGLPCVQVSRNVIRYDLSAVRQWMQSNREPVPQDGIWELVALNRSVATMPPMPLTVHGAMTSLQAWLPDEVLRLAELPVGEERETALRDAVGFARVYMALR